MAPELHGRSQLDFGSAVDGELRVSEPGEVIELSREQLLALVQTDAELSEILMRAFILRRLELIARDVGGSWSSDRPTTPERSGSGSSLTRNGHPFHFIDLDRDADAQELLDRFHVDACGRAGADLRGRDGVTESDERADRGLPRLQ
jgi:thioredoxin reductase (NADPH)